MLRNQQSIRKSKSQSSIRHQVRKLRAKVKALIPCEVCNHFEKRNQRIQKINLLRVKNQQNPKKNNIQHMTWSNSAHKFEPYHVSNDIFENKCKNSHHYQFDKLKPEQMEQINQDKNYYLGQKNVDAYNEYLKKIKSSNNYESLQESINLKQGQNINTKSPRFKRISNSTNSFIWESKQTHNSFDKTNFTQKNNIFKLKQRQSFKKLAADSNKRDDFKQFAPRERSTVMVNQKLNIGSDLKLRIAKEQCSIQKASIVKLRKTYDKKTPQEIKQYIEQQDRQKRMYQKLKIQMQMSKAQTNQRQTQYKKYFKLRQMANQQKQRHDMVIKKKNLLNKKGEVVKIDEQLRKIIIHNRKNVQGGRSNSCFVETSRNKV